MAYFDEVVTYALQLLQHNNCFFWDYFSPCGYFELLLERGISCPELCSLHHLGLLYHSRISTSDKHDWKDVLQLSTPTTLLDSYITGRTAQV